MIEIDSTSPEEIALKLPNSQERETAAVKESLSKAAENCQNSPWENDQNGAVVKCKGLNTVEAEQSLIPLAGATRKANKHSWDQTLCHTTG